MSNDLIRVPPIIHPTTGTVSTDINFAGFKAVALACDQGTSFPASPVTGQWFYKTDIKTLFLYEVAWKAIISFGAVNLYVDATNGTDAVGKGYSSGAGATKTVQYAIDLIPPTNGGNVVIYITAGTYNENLVIRGKVFSGDYSITLQGTDGTSVTNGTATGAGSDTDTYYLDDSGKAWTTDAYASYLIAITGGTGAGQKRLIESNTATRLRIIGKWDTVPDGTSTYKVYLPGTVINKFNCAAGQTGVILNTLEMSANSYSEIYVGKNAALITYNCRIANGGDAAIGWMAGLLIMCASFIQSITGSGCVYFSESPGSELILRYSWVKYSGTGSSSMLELKNGATMILFEGTVISNSVSNAINVSQNSNVAVGWEGGIGGRARIYNNSGWGVRCDAGGQAKYCGNPYYANNGSGNYSGDATSYGYAQA